MLAYAQIIVSLILIALIVIQERSAGTGGLFGGSGGGGSSFQTRRGVEKFVYYATIGAAALFALLAILSLTTPR